MKYVKMKYVKKNEICNELCQNIIFRYYIYQECLKIY